VQPGGRSESGVIESEWQRVEYLEELAQWLYYHELPLQDSVDLLQWAADVVLSLHIEPPPWLETASTEGCCYIHFLRFLFTLHLKIEIWCRAEREAARHK